MAKPIHIYKISRNYTRCEIWHGSRAFNCRIGTTVITPDKGLTRRERYTEIVKCLVKDFGLVGPSYRPTKAEERKQP